MSNNLEIELIMTCSMCPEQYDMKINGEEVGYLRLRHGQFTVECPYVGGEYVYVASPRGDGCFDDDERDRYLDEAKEQVVQWYINNRMTIEA